MRGAGRGAPLGRARRQVSGGQGVPDLGAVEGLWGGRRPWSRRRPRRPVRGLPAAGVDPAASEPPVNARPRVPARGGGTPGSGLAAGAEPSARLGGWLPVACFKCPPLARAGPR